MADKQSGSALPGFTTADTLVMAAAYYYSKNPDVDYEKVMEMVGSKSAHSVRERLRIAKKKSPGAAAGTSDSTSSVLKDKKSAPAGGIDKKFPTKVNKSPRKAGKPKVKEEDEVQQPVEDDSDATGAPFNMEV